MVASLHLYVFQFMLIKVHSYLDPGSGSFILQLVLATFLGWLIVLRSYWTNIKDWLIDIFTGKPEDDSSDQQ